MTTLGRRPAIGWGKVVFGSLIYLVIVVTVAAILFTGYEFRPVIGAQDALFDPIVYIVALAFLAYLCQRWISGVAGGKWVIETLVSLTMLVLIGITLAVWFEVPLVAALLVKASALVGYPIVSVPTPYNRTVALIFGVLAIWDIFFEDILGVGRRAAIRVSGTTTSAGFPTMQTQQMDLDLPAIWNARFPDGRVVPFRPTQDMLDNLERAMRSGVAPALSATGGGGQ